MTNALSERRMAENEVYFRQQNESVQEGFKSLHELANETGHKEFIRKTDMPLHFYCECSDENCHKRIELKLSDYTKIHRKKNQFVVLLNHDVAKIEKVVYETDSYAVVRKFIDTPDEVDGLNVTNVVNA